MNAVEQFQPGQIVTWDWQPSGGYGYIVPVRGEVLRCTVKRVLIKTEMLKPKHEFVERWVKPESLRRNHE